MYFVIINAWQTPLVNIYFKAERPEFFWTAIRDYLLKVMPGYEVVYHSTVPKITMKLNNNASTVFINVLRHLLEARYENEWQYLRDIPSLLQTTLNSLDTPEKFANALCYYQDTHGRAEALRAVYVYYRDFT